MARATRVVCGLVPVLALVGVTLVARAVALPGALQLGGGAHLMVLLAVGCTLAGDVQGCSQGAMFAGFDLAFHGQIAPWFALGLRGAGSGEFGQPSPGRSLWLWRISGEARFDPPIWPRGLWAAAELGAVIAVNSGDASV